jgi:2-oxoglutarate/2-oxoacid ferredoxin oxidoreductase subunit beta
VGEAALLVHDEHREDPALAFSLSRIASQPTMPTPCGVFRDVSRPAYEQEVQAQLVRASERSGPGDLGALLGSGATWNVT